MAEKFPMTKDGLEKLKSELENLKNIERPNIIKAISEAREHGDLSENVNITRPEKTKLYRRKNF